MSRVGSSTITVVRLGFYLSTQTHGRLTNSMSLRPRFVRGFNQDGTDRIEGGKALASGRIRRK